ncbi:MAG TPA: hypothetical protein DEG17_17290 [Cyanobacteria bacterium UBA11149]|nr:hypothetical protein [Cyanobacteria bacterium UBA11367]HBE59254.1 hypothetical protein [Cyanobacteria bacterium UBA11366]HBK65831.1 hypothetical protein [Cyanobacteria bacterium UBA11166]HBR77213.1 hypothetical protein [Cyanobacteria bacterium UBA11159]HBS71922.1 hypothetical protein [Cyanobacteria bacterium UBA11153]HBW90577.1 hypothetical protein [Cyanobacteria bacterium UBA11149]HCA94360.1 hypothetical protein [Cyanobacteria bacterium UBA9226]
MKSEIKPHPITEILVECPKCGKKSVVQRSSDVYQCLACDFVRDFAKPEESEEETGSFWPLVIVAFLTTLLMMLFQQSRLNNLPVTQPQSLSVAGEVMT